MRTNILRCRNHNGMVGMCPHNAIDCHGAKDDACYWHENEKGEWY
jgi:hypothetical protein